MTGVFFSCKTMCAPFVLELAYLQISHSQSVTSYWANTHTLHFNACYFLSRCLLLRCQLGGYSLVHFYYFVIVRFESLMLKLTSYPFDYVSHSHVVRHALSMSFGIRSSSIDSGDKCSIVYYQKMSILDSLIKCVALKLFVGRLRSKRASASNE